jgi:hypothetical protein
LSLLECRLTFAEAKLRPPFHRRSVVLVEKEEI